MDLISRLQFGRKANIKVEFVTASKKPRGQCIQKRQGDDNGFVSFSTLSALKDLGSPSKIARGGHSMQRIS